MRSQRSGLYLYFLYQKDNILCTTFMTFVSSAFIFRDTPEMKNL